MAHLVDMGGSMPRDDSVGSLDVGKSSEAGGNFNLSRDNFRKTLKMDNPVSPAGEISISAGVKIEKPNVGSGGGQMESDAVNQCSSMIYLDYRSLIDPNEEDMASAQKYFLQRIGEGQGEFVYELGSGEVEDSGLTQTELDKSIVNLKQVCFKIDCSCVQIRFKQANTGGPACEDKGTSTGSEDTVESSGTRWVSDFLIRKNLGESDFIEVRVAVVGNVDAGKSTLLGVLTNGVLDDGRGNARQSLFRHKHEIESGRTSSVGNDILGFDANGDVVNKSDGHGSLDWTQVCKRASKVITFIDLAGHEKYLKTTIFGMTGHMPDFSMLMVGANAGVIGMTKEHLGLALALNVPVFVVVTKIDMCPENVLKDTLKLLQRILKSQGCRKIPIFIQNKNDVVVTATNFTSERVCPIFQISNVTGENLDLLKMFLNLLSARSLPKEDEPPEFQIDDIYSVPGVGTVVAGTMLRGTISLNDTLLLGPDSLGDFTPVPIKSIQRKRLPVKFVRGGQTASFALKKIKRNQIRKGMVLVAPSLKPFASWEFEGEILVLHHPTTISVKYQAMVHCCSVRQTAAIIWMDKEALRTGDKASIRFRFIKHPEYLRVGTRLVFREGRTKAVGSITKVYHPSETPFRHNARSRYGPKYSQSKQGDDVATSGSQQSQGQRFGRRRGGVRQRKPPMGANFSNTSGNTGSTSTSVANDAQTRTPSSN